ncbi:MAG: hypothetical protein JNM25_14880 [Planctomycetes bacterium]|nr:hypothetical protein [Planctomycetota bacterium]
MHPTAQVPAFRVQIGATGHRSTWLPVATFAAASFACRTFIEANDLGASRWRGGRIIDAATEEVVATVSYNGRVWLADGSESLQAFQAT